MAACNGSSRHREEKALASKLDQLRAMTTVVADTGDLGAVARLKPVDCTTNPTIVLNAVDNPEYGDVVEEALVWGRKRSGDAARVAAATADRIAVSIGVELLRLVPGFVSTEVDANLSFNIGASVARARQIIDAYKQRGVEPERVLIKLASTWEGIRAAQILQSEGVKCNMTLLLNRAQAIASAEAGVFLISPFVGRIYDWHKKSGGKDFAAAEDPGVRSVRDIYEYYKSNGIETVVMGASFRNSGQIEALAGCDRLTIAPVLMDALASERGELKRVLAPTAAEPRSLRTAEDGICRWFVSEDAVDIKHPDLAGPMDENTFRWIMNDDAMATEKLAEGIRVFATDLKTLRRRIAERLE
jgi:transaldolase